MGTDNRKYIRFECVVPVDVVEVEGETPEKKGAEIENVSREGLCLVLSFNTDFIPGKDLDFEVRNPDDKTKSNVKGEVIWSRSRGDKIEVGLKIRDMEKGLKARLLDLGYAAWLEEQKKTAAK